MALLYTTQDIITASYRMVGLIPDGGTPTAAQLSQGLVHFNSMLKNWMGYGVDTWARASYTIPLVAGQASYSVGPGGDYDDARPLRVLFGYRSYSSIDVPLNEYSKQEYYNIPNKAQAGIPVQYYYDQESPVGNIFLWPVPDATLIPMSVTFDVMIPFSESALGTVPDMPDHWVEAAINNLAIKFAVMNGRPVNQHLDKLAQTSLDLAKKQEYEQADIYLQPDYRYGNQHG